ncbi:hypothetical protein K488DRAFT_92263 [Vararia minispora EC-137]|uniref:Uncharacterized protein n=1 Tax=Vararia minispora EC-137 TaxID=1314806 RepID=A0ACB8Q551_9AGAM|nr:hypothetical protein K488DRAFT_92263 [Vararia minispora EC-137]
MPPRFYAKNKNPGLHSKAKKGSLTDRSGPPTERSSGAAGPRSRGRPPSIKSKVQRDWLEERRPTYERAVQKGKKATGDFLSSTTTAFLEEFGWTSAHFLSSNGEEQAASRDGTDAAAQRSAEQTAAIFKLARQKVCSLFWQTRSANHAAPDNTAELLLQSFLKKGKPLRRPKLVNVFRRSPHYTPEMRAECIRRRKEASGEVGSYEGDDDGSADGDGSDGDGSDGDGDGGAGDDESADSSGDDDCRAGKTVGRRNQKQRLAQEEKYLREQLEASSADVMADIEQRAQMEYEEKVAQRQAWLAQGPKNFEEAAVMMQVLSPLFEKLVGWLSERGAYSAWYIAAPDFADNDISVYTFLGGVSPPPDDDGVGARLRFDQYDAEGHADICERIHDHGMRGLAPEFRTPASKARPATSEASSPPAMRLADDGELDHLLSDEDAAPSGRVDEEPSPMGFPGLVFPQSEEDVASEDDTYWPGEVLTIDPFAGDGDASDTFQMNGAEGEPSGVSRATVDGDPSARSGTSDLDSAAAGRDASAGAGARAGTNAAESNAVRAEANAHTSRGARAFTSDVNCAAAGAQTSTGLPVDARAGTDTGVEAASTQMGYVRGQSDVDAQSGMDVAAGGATREISGAGAAADDEQLGDLMTQEELEYWDSVMWPDEGVVSPKEVWLRKVSKPWRVKGAAGGRGKARKSWLDKHAQTIAEVVRSMKGGPPGMESSVAYPGNLMDVFDAAAALEELNDFEVRTVLLEYHAKLMACV